MASPAHSGDFQHLLGRSQHFAIRRFSASGAFLAESADERADAPCLLLIGKEIPLGARVGDELDAFVYLDSEGRPLATTRSPKLGLGEVRFLRVTDRTAFGSFVDWGLEKDLLVPLGEQIKELALGAFEPIGLYLDDTGRLAGTMRVSELLAQGDGKLALDTWIDGEAWRNDSELGLFVILERRAVGLVPASEPHRLRRGEASRFRVARVLADGKVELSLRGYAHEELADDAAAVLRVLSRADAPRVGDQSSPDELRALFGLSKKAFKRAVGRLLKQRLAELDERGFLVKARGA
ncbi:MAG TPA: S1-like domain-containing RNA-binding protein [Polyangiaceae bacterium]